eukprot:6213242-Pleurochrysis_carterae.AAC.1
MATDSVCTPNALRCLRVLRMRRTSNGHTCAGQLGVRVPCGVACGVQLDVLVCGAVQLGMRVRGAA